MIFFITLKQWILRNKVEVVIFAVAFTLSLASFYLNTIKFQNDDQFTIYRYIENIASGKGFVFNEGERVLGSTTPLFTLLGSLLKFVFSSISTQYLIAYLNSILISLSAVVFFRLSAFFLSRNFSYLAVLIFGLSMAKTASAGMETALFVLVMLLFFVQVFSAKNKLAAFYLGLALLTRPDAGLIAVLACLFWFTQYGFKKTLHYCVIVLAVVLPWVIFATLYFGSPIPQSLLTKSHVADIVYQSRFQALKVQLASMSRVYWGKILDPDNIVLQVIFNLSPFIVFIGFALKDFWKKYWLFFGVPILYLVSFSYSNPVMYPWYISQLEPLWILFSIAGVSVIYNYFVGYFPYYKKIITALFFFALLSGPVYGYAQLATPRGEGSKITLYKLALYVRDHKKPGDVVGLSNIGIVSYTLMDTYIYDFIGLTQKDTLRFYPVQDECLVKNQYVIPPLMIKEIQPDWIIAGEAEWVPCFVEGEWFLSRYKPVYDADTTAIVWQKIK